MPEKAPPVLGGELGMGRHVVSSPLRLLTAAGLLPRRRSGAWAYCIAASPYSDDTLSGALSTWLRQVLCDPTRTQEDCRVRELCNLSEPEAERVLRELLFEAATAFTNVRRLQLLRLLTERGELTVEAITEKLHMSEHALSRHAAKLLRRGYLAARRVGHCVVYQLPEEFKTPIHARWMEIVRAHW